MRDNPPVAMMVAFDLKMIFFPLTKSNAWTPKAGLIVNQQFDHRGIFESQDVFLFLNLFQHKGSESFPCCIASCMQNTAMAVSTFKSKHKVTVFLVELHAKINQFLNTFLPFGNQYFYCIEVAKSAACKQGILNM